MSALGSSPAEIYDVIVAAGADSTVAYELLLWVMDRR